MTRDGSKDKSIQIAREYTDLVFSEPWPDSFARARNSASSKASCDFVMELDADDVMRDEDILKLLELKKQLTARTAAKLPAGAQIVSPGVI